MMDIGINVISTTEDMRLFTDAEYNGKVKRIVEDLKKNYCITNKHAIACYADRVELRENRCLCAIRTIDNN